MTDGHGQNYIPPPSAGDNNIYSYKRAMTSIYTCDKPVGSEQKHTAYKAHFLGKNVNFQMLSRSLTSLM